MKRPTRTLANLGLSLLLPLTLVTLGLGKEVSTVGDVGVGIGATLCTGTQCSGSGGCRATPKFGGTASYKYYPRGSCTWVFLDQGSCNERTSLTCLEITYYTSTNCTGSGTSAAPTTVTGC